MSTSNGTAGPPLPWLARPQARSWTCGVPEHVRSGAVRAFHASLHGYAPTPLTEVPGLASELGAGRVFVKDESASVIVLLSTEAAHPPHWGWMPSALALKGRRAGVNHWFASAKNEIYRFWRSRESVRRGR